jgi:hypothetical protein
MVMTKNEFFDYVKYLDKLFNTNNSDDKEVLATWYKSFENTHLVTAKEMAQMYLEDEQGRFKLAKLLQYKSKALAGKTYFGADEKKDVCKFCGNTGYIQIEIPYRKTYTTTCKRCFCKIGQGLNQNIKQATLEEYKNGTFIGGALRRMDLHNVSEQNTANTLEFNNLFKK